MASNFLLQPLAVTIFLLVIITTHLNPVQSDTNLIAKTCKQTPYYNLCYSTLVSDPRSSKADVSGLALIIVGEIKTKATATLKLIKQLQKKSPPLQHPLSSCASKYDAILSADIPEAIEALQLGNPKFAQNGMNDAALEANSCENDFQDKSSPLTSLNNVVHHYSVIASAIVQLLL